MTSQERTRTRVGPIGGADAGKPAGGEAAAGGSGKLPELCTDLFAFALSLRAAADPGDAERLFANVTSLLEKLGTAARERGVDSAHLEAARYALCALLDETVLGSRWQIKEQWFSRPLQMAFFGDFTAGEQFFQRLAALRQDARHNADAIEVYAMCLAAGFRGKYADLAGMQKVADLLAELNDELRRVRGVTARTLSKPVPAGQALPGQVRRVPVWILMAIGAGVVLVLLFVLDALLASQASTFLEEGVVGAGGGR